MSLFGIANLKLISLKTPVDIKKYTTEKSAHSLRYLKFNYHFILKIYIKIFEQKSKNKKNIHKKK